MRSTKRKLSRAPKFHGIKGSGAGDRPVNKTPIVHLWGGTPERLNNGSINIGWWNHDMFLEVHPTFRLHGSRTLNMCKSYLRGPGDNPWTSGPKTSHLNGVQVLGDRRHESLMRDELEYRNNSVVGGDLWIQETRPSNRKYNEDRLRRIQKEKLSEAWAKSVKTTNSRPIGDKKRVSEMWTRLHTMGASGMGLARKKVS